MKQIPVRKYGEIVGYALVDDEDYERFAKYKWFFTTDGYAGRSHPLETRPEARIAGRKHRKTQKILMHREVLGLQYGNPTHGDHIDRNKLNNQRYNLRCLENNGETQQNKNSYKNSTSKYRGVSLRKRGKTWVARVKVNGEVVFYATFKSEEEAAAAAKEQRRIHLPLSYED